jgi:hypothetical protein
MMTDKEKNLKVAALSTGITESILTQEIDKALVSFGALREIVEIHGNKEDKRRWDSMAERVFLLPPYFFPKKVEQKQKLN